MSCGKYQENISAIKYPFVISLKVKAFFLNFWLQSKTVLSWSRTGCNNVIYHCRENCLESLNL